MKEESQSFWEVEDQPQVRVLRRQKKKKKKKIVQEIKATLESRTLNPQDISPS